MSSDREDLKVLNKLLRLLNEEEFKISSIANKTNDNIRNLEAINSLKKEIKETINTISSKLNITNASINGIPIEISKSLNISTLEDKDKIDNFMQNIISKINKESNDELEEIVKITKPKNKEMMIENIEELKTLILSMIAKITNKNVEDDFKLPTLKIGEVIEIEDVSNIYKAPIDSILGIDQITSLNTTTPKIILGISIYYNNKIINILSNYPDYDRTISNLLNDGGKIINYIIGNKEHVNKDIRTLKDEEIKNLIIGFCDNINIEQTKKRGIRK